MTYDIKTKREYKTAAPQITERLLITRIVLVYHLGNNVFRGCIGLTGISISKKLINERTFGWGIPEGLKANIAALIKYFKAPALKKYFFTTDEFRKDDGTIVLQLMRSKLSDNEKNVISAYMTAEKAAVLAEKIIKGYEDTDDFCNAASNTLITLYFILSDEHKKKLFSLITGAKNGKKAIKLLLKNGNTKELFAQG